MTFILERGKIFYLRPGRWRGQSNRPVLNPQGECLSSLAERRSIDSVLLRGKPAFKHGPLTDSILSMLPGEPLRFRLSSPPDTEVFEYTLRPHAVAHPAEPAATAWHRHKPAFSPRFHGPCPGRNFLCGLSLNSPNFLNPTMNPRHDISYLSCNDPPSLGGVACREVHATFFMR
jgi:hypothetical protein